MVLDNEYIILVSLYILYIRLTSGNAREISVNRLDFQDPEPNTKSGPSIPRNLKVIFGVPSTRSGQKTHEAAVIHRALRLGAGVTIIRQRSTVPLTLCRSKGVDRDKFLLRIRVRVRYQGRNSSDSVNMRLCALGTTKISGIQEMPFHGFLVLPISWL